MNIVELAKTIQEDQTAYSKELGFGIYSDGYGFHYVDIYGKKQDSDVECNFNILLTTDWEIEVPYVDFWTAWQAAKNGHIIRYEHDVLNFIYATDGYPITKEMIDGRWEIIG